MSISNYTDLKSAISTWYNRSDLAANADDFIALSEGYFNLKLRCREMEATATLTPVSNICTLPADYLEYKRVVEVVSPRRSLRYITEDAADQLFPFQDAGPAACFTIIGNSLKAYPLSTNDIEMVYFQQIPALSSGNPTNWLLTRSPNLYLHSCLLYAAEFVHDDAMVAKEATLVSRYMDDIQELETRSKFGNAGVTIPSMVF